jgi:putative oxidoreductase
VGRGLPLRLREPGAPLTAALRRARALDLLRIAAGIVFLAFGIGKFTSHASELASFRSYGLPFPEVFVYAIGVLEVVGGALLVLGLYARLVALPLAGDMVGAIAVSGIAKGEIVSLTLAPALLVVMCLVMWSCSGPPR